MPPVIGPFLACGSSPTVALLMLLGFVLWIAAYVQFYRVGLRDQVYSIPWPNICLNLAWEIYFGVLCPAGWDRGNCTGNCGSTGLSLVLLWAWLFLDLLNTAILLRYGRRFQQNYYLKTYFFLILGSFFVVGFAGEFSYIVTNNDVNGTVTAWVINLVMSMAFVGMYMLRQKQGLSLGAAWAKMLGSAAMGLGIILSVLGTGQLLNLFMSYLILTTFLVDCLYIFLLYRRLRGLEVPAGGMAGVGAQVSWGGAG